MTACSEKESPSSKEKQQANPYYEKAFVFLDKYKPDSAFYYLNKGKELFSKNNDSFGIGKSLVNMAIIQETAGDNFGSIETSLQASRFFKEKDTSDFTFLFCNYNNLGVCSNNLNNYRDAANFYNKAYDFAKDPVDQLMLANNIAVLAHNEKKYSKAVNIYHKLLDSVGLKSEFYPKLLLNFSRSRWFEDRNYNPTTNYLEAEKLSKKAADNWTTNASYAYLSAYYLTKNQDSARFYADKMLRLAKRLKYPDDELEALQNLVKISDGEETQVYFERFTELQDSLSKSQNKAKNQFALIRFESEKAKSENIILQKQKTINEYKMLRQKIISWSVFVFSTFLTIGLILWIKRKRRRLMLEANQKLQEQRLDFSKKVHDVVANGIYEVMTTIENQADLPKEKILDKLEIMYEKSRDLSYENPSQQEFDEKIFTLLSSFDNENTKIIIIGNDAEFWKNVDLNKKEQLYQIIRELLVNMKKHSFATQVILKFAAEEKDHFIRYKDNGIGIKNDFKENNGFSNIRSRLEEMHAKLKIEESDLGMKLSIKF